MLMMVCFLFSDDIYEQSDEMHIAMEYCSGGDVFEKWYKSERGLAEDNVKIVAMKLCSALAYVNIHP